MVFFLLSAGHALHSNDFISNPCFTGRKQKSAKQRNRAIWHCATREL